MAVAFQTLFRVVQIFKGNIQRDLVLREPRALTLGEHSGCDLLIPLPGSSHELRLVEPAGDRYRIRTSAPGGDLVLRGTVHRKDGGSMDAAAVAAQGGDAELAPGDWALFDVVDADDLQVFCQYIRVPVPKPPPLLLRPLVGAKDTAAILLSHVDQYTLLAAVTIIAFLLMGWLHIPHGAELQSDRMPRKFMTLIRKAPQRSFHKRKLGISPIKRRTVVREASNLSRRSSTPTARAERRVLSPRNRVNPRLNKGAVKAINRALMTSGAVQRTFRDQGGVMVKLDEALAGLERGGGGGPAGGGGEHDSLSTQGSGGGASVGRTSGGTGPNLGTPVRARGMIGGRSDRRVRVARLSFGGGAVSGTGLTKGAIGRVVRSRRGSIKYCYERVLRTNPDVGSGKIVVSFKIGPNGRVHSARVASSSLKDGGKVGSCITRAIRRWPFPKSQGFAMVRYPFLFSSGLK